MATIPYTSVTPISGIEIVTWANLANGDDGADYVSQRSADRSIQVEGTFGAAGSVRIEGSNYATAALYQPFGDINLASIDVLTASRRLVQLLEAAYRIRPRVTAGDGTTSLTITLYLLGRQ